MRLGKRDQFCSELVGDVLGTRGTFKRIGNRVQPKLYTCIKARQVLAAADSSAQADFHELPELGHRCQLGRQSGSRIVEVVGKFYSDVMPLVSLVNHDEGIRTFRQFQDGYTISKLRQKLLDEKT